MTDLIKVAWVVLAVLLAYVGLILALGAMTIWQLLIGVVFLVAAVAVVLKLRRRRPALWR